MGDSKRPKPVVLCVLDGFGERSEEDANAVTLAPTPAIDALRKECPVTTLEASGLPVGLPKGQMGSSEIGHFTLGAGRVTPTDLVRITQTIRNNKFSRNETVDLSMRLCTYNECTLHVMGLLSDGGIHSSMDHLFALIDVADWNSVPVVIHAFLDGRDTPPQSAENYILALEDYIENKDATIGTLSGRYYAMDRDERWDRVYQAYHAIVRDKVLGPSVERWESAFEALRHSYTTGVTDEFMIPVRIGDYKGINGDFMCDFAASEPIWGWNGEDAGFAFNFRPDRMRQLTSMLTREGCPDEVANDLLMDRDKPVTAFQEKYFHSMTSYDTAFENVLVAFPKQETSHSLGQLLAEAGLKQLRCAESEKYAHVTYFFSCGREEPFEGESRILVPSPKRIATYDEKPEMSAGKVASKVVDAVESGEVDFIIVNFANPDMVGHTGKLDAAIDALKAVDDGVKAISDAVRKAGGVFMLTADHGNCETMKDEHGMPHTAHTTNPVPFVYLNENDEGATLRTGGSLADVAPTILQVMDMPQPEVMTGQSLLVKA